MEVLLDEANEIVDEDKDDDSEGRKEVAVEP